MAVVLLSQQCNTLCISGFAGDIMFALTPSPPVDIVWAMVIVWRIRGKIIRTVLCCVVYSSCTQWYAHTHTSNS